MYKRQGLGGLGLLDGDDAVGADLLHGLGDQLADELVAAGNGADAGDVVRAVDLLGVGLDGGDSSLNGFGPVSYTHLDVYKRQSLCSFSPAR